MIKRNLAILTHKKVKKKFSTIWGKFGITTFTKSNQDREQSFKEKLCKRFASFKNEAKLNNRYLSKKILISVMNFIILLII